MYPRRILLSLSLLCFIAGGRSEPQLAFSILGLLQSGETARGCLEVRHHTETVDVNIVLEMNGMNHTILNEQVPVDKSLLCPEFQVPSIFQSVPVFITVKAFCQDFNYTSRRPLVIAPIANITFIQTEKYMYKQGDKVRFNVFTLQNNLTPMEEIYLSIDVKNPAGDRLFQWKNQKTENYFLSLEFSFLDDQGFGLYTISVQGQFSGMATKQLMVDEYFLPKYSVGIEAPNSITILEKNISYKATATYTYGKGVPGKVTVRICRPPNYYDPLNSCNRNPDGICSLSTGELDANGQFRGEVDVAQFQLDRSGYRMALNMQLTVAENSTDVQITESKTISITSQLGRVYFTDSKEYFKKGINYSVAIAVEDGLGQLSGGQEVEIQMEGKPVLNLTTGPDGKARGELDTSQITQSIINIQAIYKNTQQCYDSNWIVPSYSNDYRQVTRFYSWTDSFIQILAPTEELECGKKYDLTVQYIFGKGGLREGETTASFVYMVTSKAKIIEYGERSVDVSISLPGEFTLSLDITFAHAPITDVIVYHLSANEVVTDLIHLNIEKCFKNQVSLAFSEKSGMPGSNVTLNLTASAKSMCGVRVIDSSILLLNQGQPLNAATVYSSLRNSILRGYYFDGYSVEPVRPSCTTNDPIKVNGFYYSAVSFPEEGDAYKMFSGAGMTFGGSNVSLFKPEICGQSFVPGGRPVGRPIFMSTVMMEDAPMFSNAVARGDGAEVSSVIESVRADFPEVWKFLLANVGESGSTSMPLNVPGTITEWKGDMICLSKEDGIGMTKYTANYTSIQVFFVDVSHANSIVRGEILTVRAFVSNYMDKCAKVRATLSPSPDFTAEPIGGNDEICICSGQRASYAWNLNALSLGVLNINVTGETIQIGDSCEGPADPNQPSRKDTVIRPVTVKPEGIRKYETKSDYVCVNGTDKVIHANIPLPENTVQGSSEAYINVYGEVGGRALSNPESVFREPTGCGEQVLSSLMLLLLRVNYLNSTGQLTEEMRIRAVGLIEIGYIRFISYRKYDGSFAAFPNSEGSAWLTILGLETLQAAAEYIPVEERILNQALVYIGSLQDLSTGRFIPRGTLFNTALKGGADDDVGFTAITIAVLLQYKYVSAPTLLRGALEYLNAASDRDLSNFNKALLFYAFTVAGDSQKSALMLQKLRDSAIEDETHVHWERPTLPNKQTPYVFSAPAASSEIEMTSYVLVGMTKSKSHSQEDIMFMFKMVFWLTEQQNSAGYYSSTSDTRVAFQALMNFRRLTYQKDAHNTVQVKYGDEVIRDFNLDADNRILLQTEPLPHIPGVYSITVSGNGCVLVQTATEFNLPVSQKDAAFSLSVETSESCDNEVLYYINVNISVSYHGIRNQSNMALIDFPLPSGYNCDYTSLRELRNQVSKVELKNNHVIMYLDNVNKNVTTYHLKLEMSAVVSNFQQQTVRVWDYYETGENGDAVFNHPCSKI